MKTYIHATFLTLALVTFIFTRHAIAEGDCDSLQPRANVTIRKYVDDYKPSSSTLPNWYQADQHFIQSQPLPGLTDFTINHEIATTDKTGTTTIISGAGIYPLGIDTNSVVDRLLNERR